MKIRAGEEGGGGGRGKKLIYAGPEAMESEPIDSFGATRRRDRELEGRGGGGEEGEILEREWKRNRNFFQKNCF